MMKNLINSIDRKYTEKVYTRITVLAFLMHIVFSVLFSFSSNVFLILYNICSAIFYIVMIAFSKKQMFRALVALIHFEVMLFVYYFTFYLGWNSGFYFYLFAMATLVYFCPFERKYISYIFSTLEVLLFLYLKLKLLTYEPVIQISESKELLLFLINSVGCFIIILYAAFISGISTSVMKDNLVTENKSLNKVAYYDQLTGAFTRYQFIKKLKEMNIDPYGIAMFDFDDFKNINDTYGHNCGDFILNETISLIKKYEKNNTNIIRWGGEEFIILFTTPIERKNLFDELQIIRKKIESHCFEYEGSKINITITIGATIANRKDELEDVVDRIDKNLYKGKNSGKNCVILE